jgi:ABC-2 type transport system permease protein
MSATTPTPSPRPTNPEAAMLATRTLAQAGPSIGPFLAYVRLEIRRALRNRRYLIFTIVFPVLLYVLYTAILDVGADATVDGLPWPVYFLVSMAAYGAIGAAMSQAVPVATERRQGWARQLRVTPLPGLAWVSAKVVTAIALTVPALVLVGVAGQVVNHVDIGIGAWGLTVVAMALAAVPFAAIGLLIGYVLDVESAQGGMVLVYFTMAILGGLFAPLQSLPDGIATIGRMLPSSHLANVGRTVVGGHLPDPVDVLVLGAWALVVGGLAAWRYAADERSGRG